MPEIARLQAEFQTRFGRPARVFSAPGRVNLIGEHTDYSQGLALPIAIDRRTHVLGASRPDRRVVAYSENLAEEFQFDLDRPGPKLRGIWGDYLEGVAQALLGRGYPLQGADLWIASDVPPGAGLSASAALEIAVGLALMVLGGTEKPDRMVLALAGQQAEHAWVGALSGILDQLASAFGRVDRALFIDFKSLATTPVSFSPNDAVLLVCETNVRHSLASSGYNQRRKECEDAVLRLSTRLPGLSTLRDLSLEELILHRELLPDAEFRRCRHVVTENARTLLAVQALAQGDLASLGALMTQSHHSLRDDYEVSCPELDRAVELALAEPSVYGARLTGGGFGGCTISLCARRGTDGLIRRLCAGFEADFGVLPEVFLTRACEGARVEI